MKVIKRYTASGHNFLIEKFPKKRIFVPVKVGRGGAFRIPINFASNKLADDEFELIFHAGIEKFLVAFCISVDIAIVLLGVLVGWGWYLLPIFFVLNFMVFLLWRSIISQVKKHLDTLMV